MESKSLSFLCTSLNPECQGFSIEITLILPIQTVGVEEGVGGGKSDFKCHFKNKIYMQLIQIMGFELLSRIISPVSDTD